MIQTLIPLHSAVHTSHNNTSFDKWRLKKKVKSNERTIVFLRYLDISALYSTIY